MSLQSYMYEKLPWEICTKKSTVTIRLLNKIVLYCFFQTNTGNRPTTITITIKKLPFSKKAINNFIYFLLQKKNNQIKYNRNIIIEKDRYYYETSV